MPRGKFDSTNQKSYPDLGNDVSSVWNFCARFSDGGEPVIASLNVGRFPRLTTMLIWCFYLIVLQKCDHILTELWAQDESCPFARPVDKKQVKRPVKDIIFLYQKESLITGYCHEDL